MTTRISDLLAGGIPLHTDLGVKALVCETHGEYESRGRKTASAGDREFWSSCPLCAQDLKAKEAEAAAIKAAEAQRREMERTLGQTMIPGRFIGRTFDTYRIENDAQRNAFNVCKAFAENFDKVLERGSCLVLSGRPGTGKSHLAAAVLKQLLPRHIGAYVTMMDLIRSLRDTWRRDSETSETQLLNKLTDLPLLVIDEIGVQYGTDGERAILFDVMDRRYREMRPTILMTNLDKDAFKDCVGERVYDRLTEVGKWVSFTWGSRRPLARKEVGDATA